MPEADNRRALEGIDDSLQAAQVLLQAPWRKLFIYSPLVQAQLFDQQVIIDALRAQLQRQPRARAQLLLPPASQWRRACPRLVSLLERLSALELRRPDPAEHGQRPEVAQMFIVADEDRVLRHVDPPRCNGYYAPSARGEARELKGFFQDAWERAVRDDELRALQI